MNGSLKYKLVLLILFQLTPGQFFAQELPFDKLSIDHVTIAVRDLGSTEQFFSDLGFTIKPGTQHENSILNSHIKFEDGTSIELLTAKKKRDEVSAWYVDQINNHPLGSGAYVALRADSISEIKEIENVLLRRNLLFRQYETGYSRIISFHSDYQWHPVFFISYSNPVTDVIKYTNHVNGAMGTKSVTVAFEGELNELHLFKKENELRNGKLKFNKNAKPARVISISVVVKELKALKNFFRKVDRKKYIDRIDYERKKIIVKTKFDMIIYFSEL